MPTILSAQSTSLHECTPQPQAEVVSLADASLKIWRSAVLTNACQQTILVRARGTTDSDIIVGKKLYSLVQDATY